MSEMLVCGLVRRSGVSKNSGNSYDFTQLVVLVPVESVARENMQVSGIGYEVATLDAAPELQGLLSKARFPAVMDVTIETKPRAGGRVQTVVTSVAPVAGKAA